MYKVVLCYFIVFLVKDGGYFMWVIEGICFWMGKLVWFKVGILKYIWEVEEEFGKEVKYVFVLIVYDLIFDVVEMI